MTARVNRKGAARWQAGHPWIFRSDVVEAPDSGPGVVRVMFENRVIGTALWSPASQISLRMLTRDEAEIDGAFWRARVAAAFAYRESLSIDATAYRLVHSEADGIPSFVVDRFGDHLVVQILSAGLETQRPHLIGALTDIVNPQGILARNDVAIRRNEGLREDIELLMGDVPRELEVHESGIRYLAAPWTGQKTGAFLDQRESRVRAGKLASGRALDCFSYHGSFAMHVARKASEVTAVDSSADALERARANARLNGHENIETVEANVFDFLREEEAAESRYDTIIVDPPAFAKRRDALPKALRAYKEINLRAMRLLEPGGYLCTFSCSHHVTPSLFREMLEAAAADARRAMRWVEIRSQSRDHPEIVQIPESTYLKGAVLQAV